MFHNVIFVHKKRHTNKCTDKLARKAININVEWMCHVVPLLSFPFKTSCNFVKMILINKMFLVEKEYQLSQRNKIKADSAKFLLCKK